MRVWDRHARGYRSVHVFSPSKSVRFVKILLAAKCTHKGPLSSDKCSLCVTSLVHVRRNARHRYQVLSVSFVCVLYRSASGMLGDCTFGPDPPPPLPASAALLAARGKVGACAPALWQRAVRCRDPVTLLKTRRHVNRATFKFYELSLHLRSLTRRPGVQAPGGFLFAARRRWREPCSPPRRWTCGRAASPHTPTRAS